MKLRVMPPGTIPRGHDAEDANEESPQLRRIANPFFIGVHEVTNSQWEQLMPPASADAPSDTPVVNVTWKDAAVFCEKLTELPAEKLAGRSYRLPTRAEWEYACRAGTTTMFSFGDDLGQLGDYAWHDGAGLGDASAVGRKQPNPWGLYDMHGNVREWLENQGCAGGSFRSEALWCGSSAVTSVSSTHRSPVTGFRVAFTPTDPSDLDVSEASQEN